MNELLSAGDISKLYSTYENAGDLIDQVEDDINKKGKEIYKPYEYVVGYAQNRGWPEK